VCELSVGNKSDREDRCVSAAEAQQLADELKVNFVETSAKDNSNVEEVRISLFVSIFPTRCHASAVYAVVVCLSVTSRCSTETANVGSRKQHHTIAPGL